MTSDFEPKTAEALQPPTANASEETGLVMENGLLVYKTGRPLPAGFVTDAVQRLRDERSQHILGNRTGTDD